MKTRYIDIPNDKWGILFIYDFDIMNADEMGGIMESFGLPEHKINESIKILLGVNTGMTISRKDLRMSVIFVGAASSMEQFADTVAHECDHVQTAICDYYNVPYGSEDAAWTQGYIIRRIAHEIKNDILRH